MNICLYDRQDILPALTTICHTLACMQSVSKQSLTFHSTEKQSFHRRVFTGGCSGTDNQTRNSSDSVPFYSPANHQNAVMAHTFKSWLQSNNFFRSAGNTMCLTTQIKHLYFQADTQSNAENLDMPTCRCHKA